MRASRAATGALVRTTRARIGARLSTEEPAPGPGPASRATRAATAAGEAPARSPTAKRPVTASPRGVADPAYAGTTASATANATVSTTANATASATAPLGVAARLKRRS